LYAFSGPADLIDDGDFHINCILCHRDAERAQFHQYHDGLSRAVRAAGKLRRELSDASDGGFDSK
jgi:hypothetical protein